MKQFIKQIQQQPHGVKSKVAFIGAGVCTSVIVIIWLSTLPARFSDIGKGADAVQNSALTEKALSAYDIYKQTVEKAQQAASTSKEASVSKSEIEDKVSALIDSVRQNDAHTAALQVSTSAPAKPVTPTPPPSSMPIMIEVAQSASSTTATHADDSNIGKPVLIETR